MTLQLKKSLSQCKIYFWRERRIGPIVRVVDRSVVLDLSYAGGLNVLSRQPRTPRVRPSKPRTPPIRPSKGVGGRGARTVRWSWTRGASRAAISRSFRERLFLCHVSRPISVLGLRVQGVGCQGFGVEGLGCRVQGVGFRILGLGFRVLGLWV